MDIYAFRFRARTAESHMKTYVICDITVVRLRHTCVSLGTSYPPIVVSSSVQWGRFNGTCEIYLSISRIVASINGIFFLSSPDGVLDPSSEVASSWRSFCSSGFSIIKYANVLSEIAVVKVPVMGWVCHNYRSSTILVRWPYKKITDLWTCPEGSENDSCSKLDVEIHSTHLYTFPLRNICGI